MLFADIAGNILYDVCGLRIRNTKVETVSTEVLRKAFIKADAFRVDFIKAECTTDDHLIALAVAMMQQAEVIFQLFGGPQLSAKQFYVAADHMAGEACEP